MQMYLLNTLFLQFVVCVTVSCLKYRLVPNKATSALLCLGPCKYIGQAFCSFLFNLMQGAHIGSATSLLLTFHYRYQLLVKGSVNKSSRKYHIIITYCVPLFFVVLQSIAPTDLNVVKAELLFRYPTYDTTNYEIIGYSDNYSLAAIIYLIMLMIGLYGSPIVAFIFRKRILKILKSRAASRLGRIEQSQSLIHGLTIQTVLPILFYFPVLIMFSYSTYGSGNSMILEFLTNPFSYIYTITDPILTIYFILPYRLALKKLVKRKWADKNGGGVKTIFHSETNTVIFTTQIHML
ncbi:unnamed protein product [Caenorhabditis angaria]|uniref:Uncharacterized protein n=1 Tax=Caenorhabditis angaria TaxID=860376 RepID=A0A9P1IYU4_9PELO|nr:unnamed protein product [Caenorhabditis angaria]